MKPAFSAIFKNSLPYGAILGGIFVVVSLIVYIADINMFSIFFSIFNFLIVVIGIPVVFVILGTNNLRLKIAPEKKINYLQAFLSCLLILCIGFLISLIYNYIFMNFINPDFINQSVERFSEMMRGYGLADDKIEEKVADIRKNMGFTKQVISTATICIVLALVMGLIVRKKEKISDVIV